MRRLTLALAVSFTLAPPALALAEDPAEEFRALHEQWSETEQELARLQREHQTAAPGEREQLAERFNAAVQELRDLAPVIGDAAAEAYRDAPNEDEQVARFLLHSVRMDVASDEYERALAKAELMIEHDHPDPTVYDQAGVAAFALHEFEKAGRYFREAREAGRLGQLAQRLTPEVGDYIDHWQRERQLRAAEAEADDLPRVRLNTSAGEIVIELFENEAPNTVANFVHLVEDGFYDGTIFHRVLPNFMAQGGDPTGTGGGGPGWAIECEWPREGARRHFRGTLSMAHAGQDTGGSQFFLTFLPTPHLNDRHTAFGRVVEGMDVLADIQRRDPARGGDADRIVEATVERKRDHDYTPKKLPSPR